MFNRSIRALLVTLLASFALVGLTADPALASYNHLCTGFAGCDSAGMGNNGYENSYTTSYWGMYAGHNCTNYAAYRLIRNGIDASYLRGQGNAYQWGGVAQAHGVAVDGNPTRGDIAWWDSNAGLGSSGHVGYVEQVGSGFFIMSDDNYGGDFHWTKVTTSSLWPTGFIHFGGGGTTGGGSSAGSPTGTLDQARGEAGGSVSVNGWTVDPDNKSIPTQVHLYTDGPAGTGTFRGATTAGLSRQDVANVYPDYGPNHGYSFSAAGLTPGAHSVYVYAINAAGAGDNPLLGQMTVNVPASDPGRDFGSFDDAIGNVNGSVVLRGWSVDPDDKTLSTGVHFYLDDSAANPSAFFTSTTANASRPDIGAAVSGAGNNHGFDVVVGGLAPGSMHTIYAYGINAAAGGDNVLLGSRTFAVPGPSPIGSVDVLAGDNREVYLSGWVLDPTAPTVSSALHVYIGGPAGSGPSPVVLTAAAPRPDVAAIYRGSGSAHGFSAAIPTAPGTYPVYVYGIDATGDPNVEIGEASVTVPEIGTGDVIGSFDTATATTSGTSGAVRVTGWAFDQSSPTTSTDVHAYLDGPPSYGHMISAIHATATRNDVANVYPAAGPAHGYEATLSGLALGTTHTLFIYGIDVSGGQHNPLLGAKTFTVPSSVPARIISMPAASQAGSSVTVRGFGTPGRTLELLYTPAGSSERVIRRATADGSGNVAYVVAPTTNGKFRIHESGTSVVSALRGLSVSAKVSFSASRMGTRRYTFTARVSPARVYPVTLYGVRSDGTLVKLVSWKTGGSGAGSVTYTFPTTGRRTLVVRTSADATNAAGSSPRAVYSIV